LSLRSKKGEEEGRVKKRGGKKREKLEFTLEKRVQQLRWRGGRWDSEGKRLGGGERVKEGKKKKGIKNRLSISGKGKKPQKETRGGKANRPPD